jgi:leucyl aminopeptidase
MRVCTSGTPDTTAVPVDDEARWADWGARRKAGHVAVAREGDRRLLLVGVGDGTPAEVRRAAGPVLARAAEIGCRALAWEGPHGEAFALGATLAAYRFDRFRPREEPGVETVVVPDCGDGAVIGDAVNLAREVADRPANDLTPMVLGREALALGRRVGGLRVEVHGRDWLGERRMGALLAVAQGSAEEPCVIELRWEPPEAEGPLWGLVGKAVTYDSGGLQIKPGASMAEMKHDMAGGAAVLGAMAAIARLHLPVRVVALLGATENVIGPAAMRPGDVLHASDGTTIEVTNTDAEGRLVLADCLLYARELGCERLVDVASLTGGAVTALGSVHAALFSTDDDLAAALTAAGERAEEPVWRLPLHPEYRKLVEGKVTDLVNSGEPRTSAHPIQGAEFLHHFAGDDVPWAHIDIAGTSRRKGMATGSGVRLLVELLSAR